MTGALAMAVDVDSLNRSSLNFYRPGLRCSFDDSNATITSPYPANSPWSWVPQLSTQNQSLLTTRRIPDHPITPSTTSIESPLPPPVSHSHPIPPQRTVFNFGPPPVLASTPGILRTRPITPNQPIKRRRPLNDVDGPNTSTLSSKKRRLRLCPVTSRLSRPFSSPATHILHRESTAGTRKFLKLPVQGHNRHSPSSLFRRTAVLNLARLNGHDDATLLRPSRSPVLVPSTTGRAIYPHPPRRAKPPSPKLVPLLRSLPSPPSPGKSKPKATPTSFSFPQLPDPLLPQFQPPQQLLSSGLGDADETDSVAFPTSAHESRYEASDDPEEVYSDFGLIFAGGAMEGAGEEDQSVEEYLDELDGISWTGR